MRRGETSKRNKEEKKDTSQHCQAGDQTANRVALRSHSKPLLGTHLLNSLWPGERREEGGRRRKEKGEE